MKNYLILKISLYLISINIFCESQHIYSQESADLSQDKNISNCDNQINFKTFKRWRIDPVQNVKMNSNKIFSNNNFTNDGLKYRRIDLNNLRDYIKIGSDQDVSKKCLATVHRIISGIANGDEWALGFIKSQPFMANNLFTTIKVPLADYDRCLGIKSSHQKYVQGKYCPIDLSNMVKLSEGSQYSAQGNFTSSAESPLMYQDIIINYQESVLLINKIQFIGLCLPMRCNSSEMSVIINRVIYQFFKIHKPIKIQDDCYHRDKVAKFDMTQRICISIIFISILLVTISTVIHSRIIKAKYAKPTSLFHKIILCFSAKKTIQDLFSVRENSQFKAKDGMSGVFVYLANWDHTYYLLNILDINYLKQYESADEALKYRQVIYAEYLGLEAATMFAGVSLFANQERSLKTQKFNYISFIIKRYIRFFPSILTNLLISLIFEHFGDGSIWNIFKQFTTDACKKNWYIPFTMWMNHLYFYPGWNLFDILFDSCNIIHWYNGVAFQLYLVSPMVFLPLIKNSKFGLKLIIGLMIISIPIQLIMFKITNVPHMIEMFMLKNQNKTLMIMANYYWPTWNYFYPFLHGILVGYLVKHKPNIYLGGRIGEKIITIFSISTTIFVIYCRHNYTSKVELFTQYHLLELYILFHKPLNLLGYSWLVYGCATGRLKTFNRILGCKFLRIIANIGVEFYTLHVFVVAYFYGTARHSMHFSDFNMITYSLRDSIVTYIFVIIVCIFISRPMTRIINEIQKYVFTPK